MTENGLSEKFGNFGPKLVFPCNLEVFGQSRKFRQNPRRRALPQFNSRSHFGSRRGGSAMR